MKAKKEEAPYGPNRTAWHQQVSGSDPCDSLGGYSKSSQQVDQNAAPVTANPYERGGTNDEKTFDPREPRGAGSKREPGREHKSQPSSGGNIPSHKNPAEGTGLNYHRNTSQTKIAGDGHVTVRPSSKQVKRVQASANNDVSSRK